MINAFFTYSLQNISDKNKTFKNIISLTIKITFFHPVYSYRKNFLLNYNIIYMSKKILNNVKDLKHLSILIKDEHMDSFNEIINLYETRTIKQLDTARNLIVKLSTSRGTGKKSTINKISKISKGINNIKKVGFIKIKANNSNYVLWDDIKNFESRKFSIYIFNDEENIRKKIRLSLV